MKMKLSFGDRIKNLREDAELNQTELASAINATQRKISYIECGKYEPSLSDIVALCKYFNVTSDYLLGLTNEKNKK
ncbi:MAG: helix-turn-helix transcriptional regulator [Ruminococcaceae bacterium]|nr:helix-turn-helix transcriptional regulator [Oscillospiraceae bacterium]